MRINAGQQENAFSWRPVPKLEFGNLETLRSVNMENKTRSSARLILDGIKMDVDENISILIAFWAGAALATLFFLPEIWDGSKAHHLTRQESACKAAPI